MPLATKNKKSPANTKGIAQQQCMFESPVKQNQSPTLYRLEIANFPYPLSFSAHVQGDPFQIYGKALRFLKLESSR